MLYGTHYGFIAGKVSWSLVQISKCLKSQVQCPVLFLATTMPNLTYIPNFIASNVIKPGTS